MLVQTQSKVSIPCNPIRNRFATNKLKKYVGTSTVSSIFPTIGNHLRQISRSAKAFSMNSGSKEPDGEQLLIIKLHNSLRYSVETFFS